MQWICFGMLLGNLGFAQSALAEEMPLPVQCYFEQVAKSNLHKFSQCFHQNASILEVTRTIQGKTAISRWAEREVFGGSYQILETLSESPGHINLLVQFSPKGWSSGFKAHYHFEWKNEKIIAMNLQYA